MLELKNVTKTFGSFKALDDLNSSVQRLDETVTTVNSDVQEKFNTIAKYFTFDVNGLTIGEVNNPYKIVIDNDEFTIFAHGVGVLTLDANGRALIPELQVTRSFNLLGFHITQDGTTVNCEYIGA